MNTVALFGAQNSGKSAAAKAIASVPGWTRLSFADPIYDMLSVLLGRDARVIDKESPIPELCGKTLRHALQTLGTEWGRGHVGKSVWTSAMQRRIDHAHNHLGLNVVIDDLRFANEHDMLRDSGAYLVRLDRPGATLASPTSHSSETDWPEFTHNLRVPNTGDLPQWIANWKIFASAYLKP